MQASTPSERGKRVETTATASSLVSLHLRRAATRSNCGLRAELILTVTAQRSRVCTRSLRVQITSTVRLYVVQRMQEKHQSAEPKGTSCDRPLVLWLFRPRELGSVFFFHSAYPGPTRHHGSGMKCRQGNECHVSGPAVAGRTRVACRLQSLLYNAGGSASAPPRSSDNVLNPYPCPSVYHTLSAVWLV